MEECRREDTTRNPQDVRDGGLSAALSKSTFGSVDVSPSETAISFEPRPQLRIDILRRLFPALLASLCPAHRVRLQRQLNSKRRPAASLRCGKRARRHIIIAPRASPPSPPRSPEASPAHGLKRPETFPLLSNCVYANSASSVHSCARIHPMTLSTSRVLDRIFV